MIRLPNIDEEVLKEIEEKLEHGRLRCATCNQLATPEKVYGSKAVQMSGARRERMDGPGYAITIAVCASCGHHNVFVRRWMAGRGAMGMPTQDTVWFKRVDPLGRAPKILPNTHQAHLEPYRAACSTVDVSPEASACMSRRCLQGILRNQGYHQKDLVHQIKALLDEADPRKQLPLGLQETVDFIRRFGNFGAHPMNVRTTLEIIPVEPGEAEWCIEIAEQLMEHYFEAPKMRATKIAQANTKLASAGKPPAKH